MMMPIAETITRAIQKFDRLTWKWSQGRSIDMESRNMATRLSSTVRPNRR